MHASILMVLLLRIQKLEIALAKEVAEKEQLALERANLIEIAIKCQESQLKLRSIYGKFKKDSELLSLVYSDISYVSLLRTTYCMV